MIELPGFEPCRMTAAHSGSLKGIYLRAWLRRWRETPRR
jgi:hypothetical protein